MKFEKGTQEYLEFRRKANIRNRKYFSKPEVKARRKIYKKNYDLENKDKINEYQKKRYKIRKREGKLWYQRFPDKVKKYRSSKDFKLKKSKQDKRWREKKKLNEGKFWMDKNIRDRHKEWYEKNRGHLRDLRRAYYLSEQGQLSIQNCNHRKLALKKDRPTDLTRKKIREIFDRDKVCVYCGSNKNFELDHIVSLTKGGSCMFNNYVLSCAKCNRSKSRRDVFYWCKLQNIEIPKIVLELLESQKN